MVTRTGELPRCDRLSGVSQSRPRRRLQCNFAGSCISYADCPAAEAICQCRDVGQRAHLALPFGFDSEQSRGRGRIDTFAKRNLVDDREFVGADRLDTGIESACLLRGIVASFDKRSEERREGKECDSKCRSGWSPYK